MSQDGKPFESAVELRFLDKAETPRYENIEIRPSWRSLFVFTTLRHCLTLLLAILSSVLSSLLKPAAAILFGKLFSTFTKFGSGVIDIEEALEETKLWCICLTALGGAAWIFDGVWFLKWLNFGELQAKQARESLFAALLEKNMRWYDLQEDGISSLTARIET